LIEKVLGNLSSGASGICLYLSFTLHYYKLKMEALLEPAKPELVAVFLAGALPMLRHIWPTEDPATGKESDRTLPAKKEALDNVDIGVGKLVKDVDEKKPHEIKLPWMWYYFIYGLYSFLVLFKDSLGKNLILSIYAIFAIEAVSLMFGTTLAERITSSLLGKLPSGAKGQVTLAAVSITTFLVAHASTHAAYGLDGKYIVPLCKFVSIFITGYVFLSLDAAIENNAAQDVQVVIEPTGLNNWGSPIVWISSMVLGFSVSNNDSSDKTNDINFISFLALTSIFTLLAQK
jgi:hypothetical protein